jgi:hypothetical protein
VDDAQGSAAADGLVERGGQGSQGGFGPVDADDDRSTLGCRRGAFVAHDEDGATGVGHDLHRDGADAGPAEQPVPHGADDDEGCGACGVDEGLARVAVANGGGHREGGVNGVGAGNPLGDEPGRVGGHDVGVLRELTEPQHREVDGERVQHVQGQPPLARDLCGRGHCRHGQGGSVDPDDNS